MKSSTGLIRPTNQVCPTDLVLHLYDLLARLLFVEMYFSLIDGSLMNNITRSDQEKNASRQVSRDGDTNIDDVSNLTMFPSLGHTDQNEMFENLFAISPLKSIASNLPSPDPTSADDSNS